VAFTLLMHSARIGTRPMRQLGATIPVPESAITGYWPGTYLANLSSLVRVADNPPKARTTFPRTPHLGSVTPHVLAFTGTDRGLLRSAFGPWSPVPKCEAPEAPISVKEHTYMALRPRRQRQNPPLQESSAIPAFPWPLEPRLRYSPALIPTTR
jgi:hypothetical protein